MSKKKKTKGLDIPSLGILAGGAKDLGWGERRRRMRKRGREAKEHLRYCRRRRRRRRKEGGDAAIIVKSEEGDHHHAEQWNKVVIWLLLRRDEEEKGEERKEKLAPPDIAPTASCVLYERGGTAAIAFPERLGCLQGTKKNVVLETICEEGRRRAIGPLFVATLCRGGSEMVAVSQVSKRSVNFPVARPLDCFPEKKEKGRLFSPFDQK